MAEKKNSGFAAVVQPAATHAVIHTDTQGLLAGDVSIAVADGSIPGYYAAPAQGERHPVMLVVQEVFGVHEHIRDVVRRFAHQGYLAVAPELYVRQGDVASLTSFEAIGKITSRVPDAQVLADLDATLAWATSRSGDGSRVGITGFCWGGRIVWLYAAHQPAVKAGVAWYGRLNDRPTVLQPHSPLELVAGIRAPVLGLYGGQDPSIPLEAVQQFQAALAQGQSGSRIHVYPDAPHAFHADYRATYRKAAAEDGWQRALAWFRQHGV